MSPHLLVADPALFSVEREASSRLVANIFFAVGILRCRIVVRWHLGILLDGLPGQVEIEVFSHVARNAAGNETVGVRADLSQRKQRVSAKGEKGWLAWLGKEDRPLCLSHRNSSTWAANPLADSPGAST